MFIFEIYTGFNMNLRNIEWKCRRGKKKFGASIFLCQCRKYTLRHSRDRVEGEEPVTSLRETWPEFREDSRNIRFKTRELHIFLFLIFHKYCRFRACRRTYLYWSPRSSSAPPPPKNSILSNRGRLSNILHETFHNEKKKYFSFFEKKFAGRRREERTFQLV